MTIEDCVFVCQRMREDDFNEFVATQPVDTKEGIAKQILNTNGEHYTLLNKKKVPVMIGGTFYENPGVATIWLIATDECRPRDVWVATKFMSNLIDYMLSNNACHRVQANSIGWRHVAQNWLQNNLGLEYEGKLKGFCKNGYDLLMYGKVR